MNTPVELEEVLRKLSTMVRFTMNVPTTKTYFPCQCHQFSLMLMTQSKRVSVKRGVLIVRVPTASLYDRLMTVFVGVVSPSCRENNLVSSKNGALIVLKAVLGLPIDEHLLTGTEHPEMHETVVEASPVRASEDVQVEKAD